MRSYFLALSLLLVLPFDALANSLIGVASVIDGDTIEIHGQRIRLEGIDAPESAQLCTDEGGRQWRCGQKAALALAERIGSRSVACEATGRDRYRRTLAICRIANDDLNEWMVRQGWALAYRRYSTEYVPAEDEARANRLNLWAGSFIAPWDWRRQRPRADVPASIAEQSPRVAAP